jgi:hypothetical protein
MPFPNNRIEIKKLATMTKKIFAEFIQSSYNLPFGSDKNFRGAAAQNYKIEIPDWRSLITNGKLDEKTYAPFVVLILLIF